MTSELAVLLFVYLFALAAAGIVYGLVAGRARTPIAWAAVGFGVYYVFGHLVREILQATVLPFDVLRGQFGVPVVGTIAIGLVGAILFGLVARARMAPAAQPKRRHPPARQVVGQSCAVCGRRIAVAAEAHGCKLCGAALHDDCAERHEDRALDVRLAGTAPATTSPSPRRPDLLAGAIAAFAIVFLAPVWLFASALALVVDGGLVVRILNAAAAAGCAGCVGVGLLGIRRITGKRLPVAVAVSVFVVGLLAAAMSAAGPLNRSEDIDYARIGLRFAESVAALLAATLAGSLMLQMKSGFGRGIALTAATACFLSVAFRLAFHIAFMSGAIMSRETTAALGYLVVGIKFIELAAVALLGVGFLRLSERSREPTREAERSTSAGRLPGLPATECAGDAQRSDNRGHAP